jgi:hypothetical protein
MKKHKSFAVCIILAIAFLLLNRCVEPFSFHSVSSAPGYLVVDGFIEMGSDSAYVTLSHAIGLGSNMTPRPESGASVSISDNLGNVVNLPEVVSGTYIASKKRFYSDREYALRIVTRDQKVYASSKIKLLNTPPIDSLSWAIEDSRLKIYVNTHGSAEDSRYFRWKVSETWAYTTPYPALYRLEKGVIVQRPVEDVKYFCWGQENPSTILIGTTASFDANSVRHFRVVTIPEGSIKLIDKYSIEVTQQSLTEEAYTYWLNLRKTTETVGGLFDPMPSEVLGNLTCETDAGEPVIGFFTGGGLSKERIYIVPSDLPDDYPQFNFPYCTIDTLFNKDIPKWPDWDLIFPVYADMGPPTPIGYAFTSSDCTDCTEYGGSTTKPSFWK